MSVEADCNFWRKLEGATKSLHWKVRKVLALLAEARRAIFLLLHLSGAEVLYGFE
jgi:hypothetical protein